MIFKSKNTFISIKSKLNNLKNKIQLHKANNTNLIKLTNNKYSEYNNKYNNLTTKHKISDSKKKLHQYKFINIPTYIRRNLKK